MDRTNETGMEGQVKFNISPRSAIVIDVLILLIILCAFLAGLWMGQKKQAEATIVFYDEFIYKNCQCNAQVVMKDGQLQWQNEIQPFSIPFLE